MVEIFLFALFGMMFIAGGVVAFIVAAPQLTGLALLLLGITCLAAAAVGCWLLAQIPAQIRLGRAINADDFLPLASTAGASNAPADVQQLARALHSELAGTPFTISASSDAVRAEFDTGKFGGASAQARALLRTTLSRSAGGFVRTDQSLEWDAHAGTFQLRGRGSATSGRQWSFGRELEFTPGPDGLTKTGDRQLGPAGLDSAIKRALAACGQRAKLDVASKVGVVAAVASVVLTLLAGAVAVAAGAL